MRTTALHVVLAFALFGAFGSGCSMFEDKHHRENVAATKVDLNTASRRELRGVQGLGDADVDRIIKGRPYGKKHDLVDRGILDEKKFKKIRDEVEVAHPAK